MDPYAIPYCLDERYLNFIQPSWLGLIYACVDLNEECWALFRPPIQICIYFLSLELTITDLKKNEEEKILLWVSKHNFYHFQRA